MSRLLSCFFGCAGKRAADSCKNNTSLSSGTACLSDDTVPGRTSCRNGLCKSTTGPRTSLDIAPAEPARPFENKPPAAELNDPDASISGEAAALLQGLTFTNRVLGYGSYGLVIQGTLNGQDVAVKFIVTSKRESRAVVREVSLAPSAALTHPHICKTYDTRSTVLTHTLFDELEATRKRRLRRMRRQRELLRQLQQQHQQPPGQQGQGEGQGQQQRPAASGESPGAAAQAAGSGEVVSGGRHTGRNPRRSRGGGASVFRRHRFPRLIEFEPLDPAADYHSYAAPRRNLMLSLESGEPLAALHEVLHRLDGAVGHSLTLVVLEYCCKGTLSRAIYRGIFEPCPLWSMHLARRALIRTVAEMARAMLHLHNSGVVHGDLKPSNVLLKSSREDRRGFTVKICDFGLAHVLPPGAKSLDTDTWGTPAYMAPEALLGHPSKASDVWSFGVMLSEALTQTPPYGGNIEQSLLVLGIIDRSLELSWPEVPLAPFTSASACDLSLLPFHPASRTPATTTTTTANTAEATAATAATDASNTTTDAAAGGTATGTGTGALPPRGTAARLAHQLGLVFPATAAPSSKSLQAPLARTETAGGTGTSTPGGTTLGGTMTAMSLECGFVAARPAGAGAGAGAGAPDTLDAATATATAASDAGTTTAATNLVHSNVNNNLMLLTCATDTTGLSETPASQATAKQQLQRQPAKGTAANGGQPPTAAAAEREDELAMVLACMVRLGRRCTHPKPECRPCFSEVLGELIDMEIILKTASKARGAGGAGGSGGSGGGGGGGGGSGGSGVRDTARDAGVRARERMAAVAATVPAASPLGRDKQACAAATATAATTAAADAPAPPAGAAPPATAAAEDVSSSSKLTGRREKVIKRLEMEAFMDLVEQRIALAAVEFGAATTAGMPLALAMRGPAGSPPAAAKQRSGHTRTSTGTSTSSGDKKPRHQSHHRRDSGAKHSAGTEQRSPPLAGEASSSAGLQAARLTQGSVEPAAAASPVSSWLHPGASGPAAAQLRPPQHQHQHQPLLPLSPLLLEAVQGAPLRPCVGGAGAGAGAEQQLQTAAAAASPSAAEEADLPTTSACARAPGDPAGGLEQQPGQSGPSPGDIGVGLRPCSRVGPPGGAGALPVVALVAAGLSGLSSCSGNTDGAPSIMASHTPSGIPSDIPSGLYSEPVVVPACLYHGPCDSAALGSEGQVMLGVGSKGGVASRVLSSGAPTTPEASEGVCAVQSTTL